MFPPGSPLVAPFDRAILAMKQDGLVDRLARVYLQDGGAACSSSAGVAAGVAVGGVTSLSLEHVLAPFGVLALGSVLAVAAGMSERMARRTTSRSPS